MNLREALKAVAPAVGDGKIVPAHAYVRYDSRVGNDLLRACRGEMSVAASVTSDELTSASFCVRHDALVKALDREGTRLSAHPLSNGVVISAGRSRVTLKGVPEDTFPEAFRFEGVARTCETDADFVATLDTLSKFTAGGDGHIWQMGVHFCETFAYAFGPFAAIFRDYPSPFDISIPPWAAKFILAQDGPPILSGGTNTFQATWPDMILTSTFLIEEAPDTAHTFVTNLPRQSGVPVPPGLKDVVARLKSYGVKRFRLANGKVEHLSDQLEIEEEVDIDAPARTWPVDPMLDALELADTIDLSGDRAVWHGGDYHGVFSGLSG